MGEDTEVQALERAVVGALRHAIHDHGPVTPEWIGSAAKRIVRNLVNVRVRTERRQRQEHATVRVYVQGKREGVLLTDAEANEIRLGLALGVRGPVLIKWCGQLLADRDERRAREPALVRPWPGPLAGPHLAV